MFLRFDFCGGFGVGYPQKHDVFPAPPEGGRGGSGRGGAVAVLPISDGGTVGRGDGGTVGPCSKEGVMASWVAGGPPYAVLCVLLRDVVRASGYGRCNSLVRVRNPLRGDHPQVASWVG